MSTTIVQELRFEAAHSLPHTPLGHKCQRLHGHSFRLEVHVTGPVDAHTGWVMDFGAVREACGPLIAQLDHHHLNEIPGLDNPTSENLAAYAWRALKPRLPGLERVVVHETCTSCCIYTGP